MIAPPSESDDNEIRPLPSASACAMPIVPHFTHSPSVTPPIWLAATALVAAEAQAATFP
jgi:hypothetical protein